MRNELSNPRPRWTRRDLFRLAVALPAAGWLARYQAMAAPLRNKVKITRIQAMAIRNIAGNCLIKIDTDAGLTGYGEAGATGPMARARIQTHLQHFARRGGCKSFITLEWFSPTSIL